MHSSQSPNPDPPEHPETFPSQEHQQAENQQVAHSSPEERTAENLPPAAWSPADPSNLSPAPENHAEDSSDLATTESPTTESPATDSPTTDLISPGSPTTHSPAINSSASPPPSLRKTTQGQVNWAQFATVTDQGNVRERNEDRLWVEAWPDQSAILAVVADGMGGSRGGAEAAEIAINTFRELLAQPLPDAASDRYEQLLQKFHEADDRIRDRGCQSFHLLGMGATIVVALITSSECLHLYAGDSRLYHWRDRSIAYYTADHSIIRILIDIGKITEAESLTHPMRSAINSCLGGRGDSHLSVDPKWDPPVNSSDDAIDATQHHVSPILTLQLGDLLLLSTDGLHGSMVNQDIQDALQALPAGSLDPTQVVNYLADLALAKGSSDNITLAAISLHTGH